MAEEYLVCQGGWRIGGLRSPNWNLILDGRHRACAHIRREKPAWNHLAFTCSQCSDLKPERPERRRGRPRKHKRKGAGKDGEK